MGLQNIVNSKKRIAAEKNAANEKEREETRKWKCEKKISYAKRKPALRQLETAFWSLARTFSELINEKILSGQKHILGIFPLSSVKNEGGEPTLYVSYSLSGGDYNYIELSINKADNFRFYGEYYTRRDRNIETHASHTSYRAVFECNTYKTSNVYEWLDDQFEIYYQKCIAGNKH